MRSAIKMAWGSVGVAVVVFALKLLAWWMTDSVALYADALESIVNVAAALAAVAAVVFAARPADANHPYGHHKAEYFSAVLEGGLILTAAILILQEAWAGFQAPRGLTLPPEAMAVAVLASALNGLWCWMLFRRWRALRSPALVADARHLMTDIVSSVGVLVGITAAAATGLQWLDPALAALTALNILWSGVHLIRESLGALMDEAPPDSELAQIRQVLSDSAHGAIEVHDLRVRRAGRRTFVEFHLVVEADMTVAASHVICDRIEAALRAEIGEALITIHVEPEGKAKHSGVLVL